jgi:hypothetical protein
MACRHIDNKFAYLDCAACNGTGYMMILLENDPPIKESCKVCGSTCLVKIPLKDIPVRRIPKSSIDMFLREACNTLINLSGERKA